MNIIAIDPGYTNGLARVHIPDDGDTPYWEATQLTNVHETEKWVDDNTEWEDNILLIEDYVGSGHLTAEAKETVARLGYFYYTYADSSALFSVETPVPQKRKCRVGLSRSLCEDRGIEGPHSWDAFAHILAWMYRNKIENKLSITLP